VSTTWHNDGISIQVDLAIALERDVVRLDIANIVFTTGLAEFGMRTNLATERGTPVTTIKCLVTSFWTWEGVARNAARHLAIVVVVLADVLSDAGLTARRTRLMTAFLASYILSVLERARTV